ncbi:MAG: alpha/beta hydrolase [SAR324 cluster bacterium]|nr:alpha/beta hydrolase [SAR324 cluster bacterium]
MSRVRVGELEIDYEMRGQGPPLVMITGFRRSRVIWGDAFLVPLARHFTLILPDNRGTGQSDKPRGGYSIEAFADDAAGLLEALQIGPAHAFGVSMGGMIVQRLAFRHAQRVRGLAIGCSNAGGDAVVPPEKEIWNLLQLLPDESMDAREVARRQEEAYYTEPFRASQRELIDEQFRAVNEHPTPDFAVQGHLKAIEDFDGAGALEEIAAPTLVITGDSDRLIVPDNSRYLAGRIPNAQLSILPGAAHFFWVEKPEESTQRLIDFFTGLGGE